MNKILIIDPGKGWGHFVSKLYCYQKLSEKLGSKIIFLTKKSNQAEYYLKFSSFCEEVLHLNEQKKGFKNIFHNLKSSIEIIKIINKYKFNECFVFHPSLRYLFLAKFSNAKNVWGLGLKFQNFFLPKNKKLYQSFFSETIKNDRETLNFVKKITSSSNIDFTPLYSPNNKLRDTVGIIIAASGIEKKWPIKNYLKLINFLIKKKYNKFLIISGLDQYEDEKIIFDKFNGKIDITLTSEKKIKDIIPYLIKCKFCVGNDTGFSHLSVNLNIETIVIYGDCPPQNYSKLINPIDINEDVKRSSQSINSVKFEKLADRLLMFLNKERWPSG